MGTQSKTFTQRLGGILLAISLGFISLFAFTPSSSAAETCAMLVHPTGIVLARFNSVGDALSEKAYFSFHGLDSEVVIYPGSCANYNQR